MSERMFKLEIGSHFFKIYCPVTSTWSENSWDKLQHTVLQFIRRYTYFRYEKGKDNKPMLKDTTVYASKTNDRKEYRFHIQLLKEFIEFMEEVYITPDRYEVTYREIYKADKINFKLIDDISLRDYQEDARQFVLMPIGNNRSRLMEIQTGKGKGILSLACIETIKERTAIVIGAQYIEKWVKEITEVSTLSDNDIYIVKGSKSLKYLIDLAKEDLLNYKIIVFSIQTLRNYYKEYEENPYELELVGYGCNPDYLFETLKIGTMIIDEVHQNIHAVYRMMTYTHIPLIIGLSATFLSDNAVIKRVQMAMFPLEVRYDKMALDVYTRIYAINYSFNNFNKNIIRTSEYGSNNYSHNAFEKSILKNWRLKEGYLKLILHLFRRIYLEDSDSRDKIMIFASSINMCYEIKKHIQKHYKEFDVRTYVEGQPLEDALEPNVIITTYQSGGTAIDIPNLRFVLQTVSISSTTANIQILGRLRKLPDRETKFYYIYCRQLSKQYFYHQRRMEIYRSRALSIKELESTVSV